MTQEQYDARKNVIPEPIQTLGRNFPIINQQIRMYALGQTATVQDALCQMIIMLVSKSGYEELSGDFNNLGFTASKMAKASTPNVES